METIIAHVREGNLQEVRPWLDDIENDVNQGDEHRFSLLHWAAREGQLAVVDLLVMRGARVNATNMGDDTALHLAASHGHIDVVHFLLNCHRFNVDVPNEHGNTPLHYACFWNHLEISEYLIKQGASLMQENKYGETPLEIARPRAAALLAPLAEALGHDLSHRKPFRDTSWLGTKTRARDATLYRLDGESWDPREVELTGALSDGHGAEVLKGSFRRCPVVVKMLKLRNCTIRQVDEDIAKLGIADFDGKENADDTHAYRDELLIARLDMADYKFTFHEKAREYNPAWMSPEALSKKSSEINLEACDMWSFGVILWELLTRMIPFGGMNPMVIGMQITTENLRLPIPTHLDPRVSRLIELCMKEDPGKRPRFDAQLIQLLDKMRERASQ
ncbi:hypothetical protein AHF37_02863 [Paragonimus kellicotti]|nr:hypothetical protein AHF37_02863 [Paragonimus kellicotti]